MVPRTHSGSRLRRVGILLLEVLTIIGIVSALIAALSVFSVKAQSTPPAGPPPPKVTVSLIAPVAAIRPGEPFMVGLRQIITPHWHTYWKNPGDSGEPTRLTWALPEGFTASDIVWPAPIAIPVGPLMNYGYENTVLLPVTIMPPATISTAEVTFEAKAEWLVCEKVCIPEEAVVRLTLPVAPATVAPSAGGAAARAPLPASQHAALFAETARATPVDAGWSARIGSVGPGKLRLDIAELGLDPRQVRTLRFFPETWGHIEPAAPQRALWTERGLSIELKAGEVALPAGKTVDGVLTVEERLADGASVRNAVIVRAAVDPSLPPSVTGKPVSTDPGGKAADGSGLGSGVATLSLWQALLFAILGGMILNLMPCVLPILSIKVLAIAGHGAAAGGAGMSSHGGDGAAARGGLAFLAGVLVSFAAMAALIMALREAGGVLGWGFQFQSPGFVLALAALFLAMGLSMSGVFEIGGAAVTAGTGGLSRLSAAGGPTGSFFTGVLATIAATPCTAPFMGAAMGFAMTRPAVEMTAVFLALGVGFALPVVVLSMWQAARALLPRPGPWMATFKQVLAFPLYGTVAWLVWVLSLQLGSNGVLAAGVVLTVVAFAAWVIGQPRWSQVWRGGLAAAAAVGAVVVSLPLLDGGSDNPAPDDRGAIAAPVTGNKPKGTQRPGSGPAADTFSMARVNDLRSAGRPVFVNLTAAWCISCKVNEQVALSGTGFAKALADHDIAYLKGDWTRRDDHITKVLAAYGRAGVPLYLLFPADPSQPAIVLPQLLTESIVLDHFAALKSGARPRR